MKDELRQFENRSDDWLADQIKAESKTSAWDLDEGKKLKMEHERHHQSRSHIKTYSSVEKGRSESTGVAVFFGTFIFLVALLVIAIIIMNLSVFGFDLVLTFIPFIYIVILIAFVSTFRRKR